MIEMGLMAVGKLKFRDMYSKIFMERTDCVNTSIFCILHGRIKGFSSSTATILFEVGSYQIRLFIP